MSSNPRDSQNKNKNEKLMDDQLVEQTYIKLNTKDLTIEIN